jgi:hypothetical protein
MTNNTTKQDAQRAEKLSTLIGRCFHTFRETGNGGRSIQHQGIVRARVEDGLYLVQYFEWFAGEANTMQLVRIEDMLAWQFYEDAEHMNFWYAHRYHPREDDDPAAPETAA